MTVNPEQTEIPTVDLAALDSVREEDWIETGQILRNACSVLGCVWLVNSGITQSEVDEMMDSSKHFFKLPAEDKSAVSYRSGSQFRRGYLGAGDEDTKTLFQALPVPAEFEAIVAPDTRESFDLGVSDPADELNTWPSDKLLAGFRPQTEQFGSKLRRLQDGIARLFAAGVPGIKRLSDLHARTSSHMRLAHYAGGPAASFVDKQMGWINPHTDWSTFTLLMPDTQGSSSDEGLHVHDPASPGNFRSVTSKHDAILLQVGDFLEVLSNGVLKACIHYVAPSQQHKGEGVVPDRYSIVFFGVPDREAEIEPEAFYSEGRQKEFGRLKVKDWADHKFSLVKPVSS